MVQARENPNIVIVENWFEELNRLAPPSRGVNVNVRFPESSRSQYTYRDRGDVCSWPEAAVDRTDPR